MEKQLQETVTRALKNELYDPGELKHALSSKHGKLTLVNNLLFQGLEKEFGRGKLLGLNLTVKAARTFLSALRKVRGRA